MVSHYTEFAAITLIHACRVAAAAGPGNLALRSAAIRAFVFVMAAACVLMLAALGSVVIAATGVLLDLLSVSAAYGVMTAIFQHGWGRRWWAPGLQAARGRPRGRHLAGRDLDQGGAPAVGDGPAR